ncbi:MAG: hexose kinase [Bauldia sp.]|uniref:1-phosphofructokinase family hexose kinase n=1 Tax=Bauldia sp. TaxID=2575872 RepID=UPI001D451C6A|nr:hexose kinase [Bauldia sp.]MCB1495467.1 hexose kinase [Bauldia sp.]
MPQILTLALNPTIDVSAEAAVVRPTHKTRTTNESFEPGGGGVNVARVITELGGNVEAYCIAGGVTGDLLADLLGRIGLHTHVIRVAGNTRMAHMVYETSTGLEYRFVPSGAELTTEEIDDALDSVRSASFSWLVASGSIPAGASPDILVRFGRIAADKGAKFVLDSHGPGLSETLGRTPVHLVKPSFNELQGLVGRDLDGESCGEVAAQMVAEGKAEIVAVTMGSAGAVVASTRGTFHIPPMKVDVKSAVGAGDSFVGAMTLALADQRPVEDAAILGAAAGTAAVITPGTRLCIREDIFRIYDQLRRATARTVPAPTE